MEKFELKDRVRKNILDLEYSKYLQYFNTCIIIIATYIIGLVVALITKQIDYTNRIYLLVLLVVSLLFLVVMTILLMIFRLSLKRILEEVRELRL